MSTYKLPEKSYYEASRTTLSHFDKDRDGCLNKEEFGHLLMQL